LPPIPCRTGPDPGIAPAASGLNYGRESPRRRDRLATALGFNASSIAATKCTACSNLNRQRAQQAERDKIIISPPRPSRRKRDFWMLVVLVNGGCVGFTGLVTHFDLAVMMFGLGAGLFLTVALTWIMWFVMDNY